MNLEVLRELLAHAAWADALIWEAVLSLKTNDRELRDKLHHLHLVQWTFLDIWRARPLAPRALDSFPTLGALRQWARGYHHELPAYIDSLAAAELSREIALPLRDHLLERFGQVRPVTLTETMLQVAFHSTWHRGQIARRLRELGTEPPLVDYIAWIWSGRPPAQWEPSAASE